MTLFRSPISRAAAATALAAAICAGAAPAAEKKGARRDATLSGMSVSVSTARAACFTDRLESTGFVAPRQEALVAAPREGFRIAEILVETQDVVAVGQSIARLAPLDESSGAAPLMLKASTAGVVGRIDGIVGAPASPQQPVVRIYAGGALDFVAQTRAGDLNKLAAGQEALVRTLGLAEVRGKVEFVDRQLEPASQKANVRISLEPNRDLRVGAFGRAVVSVGRRCGVGAPYSGVMYQPDGTIMHVVKGNTVEARKVEIGLLSGTIAEITSGISENEVVVVRSGPFLRDGDQVLPIMVDENIQKK